MLCLLFKLKLINLAQPHNLIYLLIVSKICILIINTYEDKNKDLGNGPLNNGYLVGLKKKKKWKFYFFTKLVKH